MNEWISEITGLSENIAGKVVGSAITVALLILLRIIIGRVLARSTDHDALFRINKSVTYALATTGLVVVGWIWVDAFDNLVTYLGLVSAGIAIGLSDLLKNIVGWAYILSRRPFKIGDRIEVLGLKGDVVDIRLFRFSMLEVGGDRIAAEQSTGRLLHVPNGQVFTEPVANYTEGFAYVWHEIPLLVTFESDWRKAKAIMEEAITHHAANIHESSAVAIRKTARQYNIKMGALSPIVYMTVRDSGVLLTGRLIVDPRTLRGIDEKIWTEILDHISADSDLGLAYPTVRNVVDVNTAV